MKQVSKRQHKKNIRLSLLGSAGGGGGARGLEARWHYYLILILQITNMKTIDAFFSIWSLRRLPLEVSRAAFKSLGAHDVITCAWWGTSCFQKPTWIEPNSYASLKINAVVPWGASLILSGPWLLLETFISQISFLIERMKTPLISSSPQPQKNNLKKTALYNLAFCKNRVIRSWNRISRMSHPIPCAATLDVPNLAPPGGSIILYCYTGTIKEQNRTWSAQRLSYHLSHFS